MIVSPPRPKRKQSSAQTHDSSSRNCRTNHHVSFKLDDMSDMSSSFGGDCNASSIFRPKQVADDEDESALLHVAVEEILDEALMGADCPDATDINSLDEEAIRRVPNFQTYLSSSRSTFEEGDRNCFPGRQKRDGTKLSEKVKKSREVNSILSLREKLLHILGVYYKKEKKGKNNSPSENRHLMESSHGPSSDDVRSADVRSADEDNSMVRLQSNKACQTKLFWFLFLFLVLSCIIGGIAGVVIILLQENTRVQATVVLNDDSEIEKEIIYEEKVNPNHPTTTPADTLSQPSPEPSYFHPSLNQKFSLAPSMPYPTAIEEPSFVKRTPSYIPTSLSSANTPQPEDVFPGSIHPSFSSETPSITSTVTKTNAPSLVDTISPSSMATSAPSQTKNTKLNEIIQSLSPDTDLLLPDSPQSKAWSNLDNNDLDSLDKFALLTLYYAINVSIWDERIASLDYSSGTCSWTGVTCNEQERVTKLNLSFQNNLFGTLPPELALATNLEFVSISSTSSLVAIKSQIGGSIPYLWGKTLSNLRILHLYDNQLIGSIPDSLWQHTKLQELRLDGNQLTGKIFAAPSSLQPSNDLQMLDLSNNRLSGSIPNNKEQLLKYANLEQLSLKGNMFDGTISNALSHYLPKLTELHIQHNSLRGTLPNEIILNSKLVWFAVHGNRLTGTLPSITHKMELPNHQIYSTIEGLELQDNQFRGPLPQGFGSYFPDMRILDISNNFFTGSVPREYAELTNLQSLLLRHNKVLLRVDVSSALCTTLGFIQIDCDRDHFLIIEEGCPCCHRCFL
mmetsp:Transcript_30559/g.46291  ORF Transcript_30559/g.46291 Transcript_30559/m.46291 type:complete len:792 (+) Transcript_30559:87-2462(+)